MPQVFDEARGETTGQQAQFLIEGEKQWRQNKHQGGPVSLSCAQRASRSAK